jgi:hypothetical protein
MWLSRKSCSVIFSYLLHSECTVSLSCVVEFASSASDEWHVSCDCHFILYATYDKACDVTSRSDSHAVTAVCDLFRWVWMVLPAVLETDRLGRPSLTSAITAVCVSLIQESNYSRKQATSATVLNPSLTCIRWWFPVQIMNLISD